MQTVTAPEAAADIAALQSVVIAIAAAIEHRAPGTIGSALRITGADDRYAARYGQTDHQRALQGLTDRLRDALSLPANN